MDRFSKASSHHTTSPPLHYSVAALALVFATQVAMRFFFAATPIIPHFLDFNPAVALVPASGYFLGPLGAMVSLAASLLADRWTGFWSVFSLFKGAGVFFMALSAWALRSSGPFSVLGFCTTGLLSIFAGAIWAGVGAEVLRMYPFTYVASLLLVHHAVFFVVLVPGLWSLGLHLPPRPGGSIAARFYVVGGAVGAYGLGVAISALFYRQWPFERYHLSDQTGLGLVLCVTPLLALHLLGLARACFGPRGAVIRP